MRLPEHGVRAALGILIALYAPSAPALVSDMVQPRATVRYGWDSNVFRLSRDQDAAALTGFTQRGDTFLTTSAGLGVDVPYARQRFQASMDVARTAYDQLTVRDNTSSNSRGTWLWQLGNRFSGQAGATASSSLSSPALVQNALINKVEATSKFANANWQFHPDWRLQAGISENSQRNGSAALQPSNFNGTSRDWSLNYVTGQGNTLGVSGRVDEGRFPNRQVVAGSTLDNAYEQRSIGLSGEWRTGGHSKLNARFDSVARKYQQLQQRNFAGATTRMGYEWNPSAKAGLSASFVREISPLEDVRTTFVLNTGVSLRASYAVSAKLSLNGSYDRSVRDFLGDAAQSLGTAAARRDLTRSAALTLGYALSRNGSATLSVQRDVRGSNVQFLDFEATTLTLGAQFAF